MHRLALLARRFAEAVAVALMAALFLAFIVQIVSRYVFNDAFGWTVEACLTLWLWLILWTSAFLLRDREHVSFDILYAAAAPRPRRIMALVSALAILTGFLAALPQTVGYVTFYKIKSSATLGIRLDFVFGVYLLFAGAMILRYAVRAVRLARGREVDGAAEKLAV